MAPTVLYVYNLPSDASSDDVRQQVASLVGGRNGGSFNVTLNNSTNSATVTGPAEPTKTSFVFRNQEVYVMPEIIETIVATLNKKWTEKLQSSELKTDSAEVRLTTSNNQVRLEGPKDDVLRCVNRLQALVVGKLTAKQSTSTKQTIAHIDMGFVDRVVSASPTTAKYQLDEPIWEYVKFSDPLSRWGDKLTAQLDHNGRIEVTGSPADVDRLKKLCETGRFTRSIARKMFPLPRGSSVGSFKSSMESRKVLIRTTSDSSYCELIGKHSAVNEAGESLASPADHSMSAPSSAASLDQLDSSVSFLPPPISTPKSKNVISVDNLLQAPHISPSPAATAAAAAPAVRLTPHSGTNFPMPFSGQLTVSVQTGSILNSGCEVIVSPCNKSLSITSGTAKVIADAAGQLLTQECSNYISTVGNLNVSGVMDTTAGNIPPPVKRVIHACGPGKVDKIELLQKTFFNCLVHASDKLKASSIAIPAIGSGGAGMPHAAVAAAACAAVAEFDIRESQSLSILTTIRFIDIKQEVTSSFAAAFGRFVQQPSMPQQILADYSSSSPQRKKYDDAALKKAAEVMGLSIVEVKRDGDCAFHAIVDQLRRQGIADFDAVTLRQLTVQHLRLNPQMFDENFLVHSVDGDLDTFLQRQAVPGQWCNEVMLRAAAEVVGADIDVVHDNGYVTELKTAAAGPASGNAKITIGLIGEKHYVSLRPSSEVENQATVYGGVGVVADDDRFPLRTRSTRDGSRRKNAPFMHAVPRAGELDSPSFGIDTMVPGVDGLRRNKMYSTLTGMRKYRRSKSDTFGAFAFGQSDSDG